MTVPRLSAGVITADLTRLGAELEILCGKAAWAHVDVMDGAFCPQLTVGPAFAAAVASTGIPVDVHLMVEEPRRMLPEFAAAGVPGLMATPVHAVEPVLGFADLVLVLAVNPGWPGQPPAPGTRRRLDAVRELAAS